MTQPLDWSLCKPGAKIVHWNGGITVVRHCEWSETCRQYLVYFEPSGFKYFGKDGAYSQPGPFDIIEILPPPEPVQVKAYCKIHSGEIFLDSVQHPGDTHRIFFNLVDGQPDCTSITMAVL